MESFLHSPAALVAEGYRVIAPFDLAELAVRADMSPARVKRCSHDMMYRTRATITVKEEGNHGGWNLGESMIDVAIQSVLQLLSKGS